jgi:hypothetical protein
MFNQNIWHAEKATFRAITGGPYRLLGPYGTIVSGASFPSVGTIPVSSFKAGTIITQGTMVRGTGTTFKADVQEEDYIHASNVVRKVRSVISDTLIELEGAFPTDISVAVGLRICRPQVYNSIYAKSTGDADATSLQETPFPQNETFLNGGAPISYNATAGEIDFTLSV